MTTVTIPDLDGFTTHYGIRVSDIGEDGDLIILGHHDKRRALAALNRHARKVWGLQDLLDGGWGRRPVIGEITVDWATLKERCDLHDDHDKDCGECAQIAEGPWWIECGAHPAPNSFPVMYWSA